MLHLAFKRSRSAGTVALVLTVLLVVAGLMLSSVANAQGGPVSFVYLRGADTLGTEQITPGNGVVRGVLQYRGQPRVEWEQVRTPLRLTLNVFAPGSAADAAPVQVASFAPQGDTLQVEVGTRGAMRPQRVPMRAGAVPLINNSLLHSALLTQLARETDRSTLPVILTQGAQTLDAIMERRGDTTTMTMAGMALHIVWADGAPVSVTVPAQNLRAVRAGAPIAVPPAAAVNYDAPANAPYTSEHVTIPTSRGYTLAGTLTRPKGVTGKVPVLVTVSGSGPQDRDSRIAIVKDYAPFRDIADTLGRRGIAVLRYDDRGVGQSGGRSSRDSATSADFADDMLSAVQFLRTRPDVDGARITVAGHSEGGIIAPLVAVKDPLVKAVAILAGPAYDGRRILLYQNDLGIKAAPGLSESQRDSLRRTVPASLDSLQRTNRWMRYFMTTDPLVTARAVKQPVLILQGDTDMQVTPEQADTLAATMKAAGNRNITMKRFPATNHLFLADPSGAPQGYATLKDTHVRRDVLGTLADWVVRVSR
ncbi:alpha/beta hydrolase family protein [Gemmatimonas phototrophica]|uniref:alpha/beta hydrolase family protein n=1 Tax=Gemmatimonas phototrophica TaxID=1379270 RepID=UPI0006A6DC8A|nr:alpha/beta fold hydrolase [Gemmatimonas phototrophica]